MARQTPPIQGITMQNDQPDIQTVAESSDLSKIAADEAFMHEDVVIMIHPSTDPNFPRIVPVTVNESCVYIKPGWKTIVKRCFVERLARAKETRYEQFANPVAPDDITMTPRTALSYPFVVIEDKNPKGRAWLENILAEPA